jgi:hypothetical protein
MSYKALVAKQLTAAFNMSKDLAVTVQLNKPKIQEFDFTTGEIVPTTVSTVFVKAIPSKVVKSRSTESLQLLVKNQDIGTDISVYSEVIYENQVWNIIKTINSNTYTSLLQLSKAL